MVHSAWRSYWSVFAVLLLSIALLTAWWLMVQERPASSVVAERAGLMMPMATSADAGGTRGRLDGLIMTAGFMRAPSGKLLPRFSSLTAGNVQVRLGPGEQYPVAWVLRVPGVPVEVMAEAGGWLRIRDHEGEEGWVPARMLDDASRTALVAPWRRHARLKLLAAPDESAALKAWVGNGVVVRVLSCDGAWCEVQANHVRGWLRQMQLWGVYRAERIRHADG